MRLRAKVRVRSALEARSISRCDEVSVCDCGDADKPQRATNIPDVD